MNNLIDVDDKTNKILKENNLNNTEEILNYIISDIQNNVLKSELTDAINKGINAGIRFIFPEAIEDQIVDLNNNIYNYGIKRGISKSVDDIIECGKIIVGNHSNGFDNIIQAQNAISNKNSSNEISALLGNGIDNLKNENKVDSETLKKLKSEKNVLVGKIEEKMDDSFSNQINKTEKLEKYFSNWNKFYNNKDFSGMEKEYKKIEKILDSLMPTKNILSQYNTIKNTQNLIKNNGKKFNLSEQEIELLNKLN